MPDSWLYSNTTLYISRTSVREADIVGWKELCVTPVAGWKVEKKGRKDREIVA